MDKFVWDEKFSVGVESIDEQHKNFFSIANKLIDLLDADAVTAETLSLAVNELENYALYHLATEEGYFSRFNYPRAGAHTVAHNVYREKIKFCNEELGREGVDLRELTKEIANFSIFWLSDHILVVDKEYMEFFADHHIE